LVAWIDHGSCRNRSLVDPGAEKEFGMGIVKMIRDRWNRERVYCTAAYWDSKAQDYEGDAVSMWRNNNLNVHYYRETAALFEDKLGDVAGQSILEIGCGTGRNCRELASRGASVVGTDFSSRAIDIARNRSPDGNPSYRVESVFDLGDTEAYDRVVSWGVVTVACTRRSQVADVMSRVRRALKPGGRILLLEPIHKGPLHRVLNMSLPEFVGIVRAQGFQIDDVRHHHFWPTRLLLAYLPWPDWITTPVYRVGDGILAAVDHKALGDYRSVCASVP
jgi:2-polyprenyl-3-methyl-5-hydroxy-6-metoxy-1,4-benzoquinol methylase